MFKMSYGIMLMGILVDFLALIFVFFMPFIICLLIFVFGIVFIVMSLLRIHKDVIDSTLIHLIEEPKPGHVKWLFFFHDGEFIITDALRKVGGFSYCPELDQQIKDWKTYRLGGTSHTVRLVGDGMGMSIDLRACLKVNQLKREHGVKNIFDIRKIFRPHLKELELKEEATTLEEAQKEVGRSPILPPGGKTE